MLKKTSYNTDQKFIAYRTLINFENFGTRATKAATNTLSTTAQALCKIIQGRSKVYQLQDMIALLSYKQQNCK